MDWSKIKSRAKEIYKAHMWDIWKPILVIALVSFVAGIIEGLFGDKSLIGGVIGLAFSILVLPMEVGFIAYTLDIVRGKEANLDYLKTFYNKLAIIFVITFLVGLYSFLWALLLIIPGIICALGYSMVYYVFVDNPEVTSTGCLNRSKELMNGYKADYFFFIISFIGWFLLGALTLGILYIWIVPYVTCAQALYYDELKKIKTETKE